MSLHTENPYTYEKLTDETPTTDSEVDRALARSLAAWGSWKILDVEERAQRLRRIAAGLRRRSTDLARSMALEMGKPVKDGAAEVEKSATTFEYIADHFVGFLAVEKMEGPYAANRIEKKSVGPVLSLMPWNYPLWQLIRFAGPGLLVGNTILFKGAMEVVGTSRMISEIFQEALPPGVFEHLVVEHERIERIVADARVRGVTFTGSVEGGRKVAEVAGRHLKKAVMELGGSDPYIVLPDADLKMASKVCASSRMVNNGQSCIAGKRFFVPRDRIQDFLEKFRGEIDAQKHGDPLDPNTQLGPLASRRHAANLSRQVAKLAADSGCRLFWRKEMPIRGAQVAPEIWVVQKTVTWVHHEEFFGPIALVFPYDNVKELPDLINQSSFGLGAGVIGPDHHACEEFASQLECGMIVFNDFLRSDVRAPFGGVKNSGFGRELSQYGLMEFCNIQSYGESVPSN